MTKNIRLIFFTILLPSVSLAAGWFIYKKYISPSLIKTIIHPEISIQKNTVDIESPERIKKIAELEKNYKDNKKPVEKNDISLCPQTQGIECEKCLLSVAVANNNWQICLKIKNEELNLRCTELSELPAIIKAGKVKQCDKLSINELYEQCVQEITRRVGDLSPCDQVKDTAHSLCADEIFRQQAQAKKDLKLCEEIINPALKSDCELVLKNLPLDSDQDGLTDSEENSYGTNSFSADTDDDGLTDIEEIAKYFTDPNNPDTDGDSYKDGEEIKNGYNPKGPGRKK